MVMPSERIFVYIWEYQVKADRLDEFMRVYGPQGEWVKLFQKGTGYISTDLHQDVSDPGRFLTVDSWRSAADRDRFRKEFADEFERLDRYCEQFTARETLVGEFYTLTSDFPE
jgi:quinol monooxygenase YgiN